MKDSLKMISLDEITYQRANLSDLDELYNLHHEHLGEIRSKYVWAWEYGSENELGSVLIIAKFKNRIIASQGIMIIPLFIRGEKVLTAKNESLLIANDFRGKGISTQLYKYSINEYEKEQSECIWGFSRKAIIPLQKAGFNVYHNVIRGSVLSLQAEATRKIIKHSQKSNIKSIYFQTAIIVGTFYSKIYFFFSSKRLVNRNFPFTIKHQLKDKNDILSLYARLKQIYPNIICLYQNEDFFNWRVLKSPIDIQTFFAYQSDILIGYLYLTVRDNFVELSEITYETDNAGLFLMQQLIEFVSNNRIKLILYTGNYANDINRKEFSLLKNFGFLKIKGSNDFVLRNLKNSDATDLQNIKNWYITGLWSEGN